MNSNGANQGTTTTPSTTDDIPSMPGSSNDATGSVDSIIG